MLYGSYRSCIICPSRTSGIKYRKGMNSAPSPQKPGRRKKGAGGGMKVNEERERERERRF